MRWPIAYMINFKNKHINAKIPVRVKLIERKMFMCSDCRYPRTENELKQIKEFEIDSEVSVTGKRCRYDAERS